MIKATRNPKDSTVGISEGVPVAAITFIKNERIIIFIFDIINLFINHIDLFIAYKYFFQENRYYLQPKIVFLSSWTYNPPLACGCFSRRVHNLLRTKLRICFKIGAFSNFLSKTVKCFLK